jgi:two-component system phosphate regulon response regulator OmpR
MGETEDRIKGLETGADDYLAKPFEPRELLLRINSLLKRASVAAPAVDTVNFSDLTYSFAKGQLSKAQDKIALSLTEKTLLEALLKADGHPVSREELASLTDNTDHPRAVDVQINRLRKKLGDKDIIKTIRFKGYIIETI